MSRTVCVRAPAKVNLFLGVGPRRDDGFHDVVTVLHSLELADVVTIEPAERLKVTVAPSLGIPEAENLAWKAVERLAEEIGTPREVSVRIEKRVPSGAGLGGGSSDAAATIVGVCHLAGIDSRSDDVLAVARSLGADVPFFLAGPAALMEGRGDVLARRLPPVRVPIALVKPSEPVPTAEAYRRFDLDPRPAGSPDRLLASIEAGYLSVEPLANNLEAAAVSVVPSTGDALAWAAARSGVRAAHVSGSGSTVFAVCEDESSATQTAEAARGEGWWAAATWTASEGVTVVETGSCQ